MELHLEKFLCKAIKRKEYISYYVYTTILICSCLYVFISRNAVEIEIGFVYV